MSAAATEKDAVHHNNAAFSDFSRRSDGFRLLCTAPPSVLFYPLAMPVAAPAVSLSVLESTGSFSFIVCDSCHQPNDRRPSHFLSQSAVNSQKAAMSSDTLSSKDPATDQNPISHVLTKISSAPRPLSFVPGDSHEVEVFNPTIDASYNHIPLSKETMGLLYPLSSLASNSLLMTYTLAPPFEYDEFKSLSMGDDNWNTWVACLKKFDCGTWPSECPRHFIIEAEAYPWIEHLATEKETSITFIVEATKIAILHPEFLVSDGTPLHDSGTQSFEFYNPALYPFQLGFCPQVHANTLYLPQPLNEMTKGEISQRKLTSLAIIELSKQPNLFKNHIIKLPITVTDGFLSWRTTKYADLNPDPLEIPDMQGTKRKWDLSSTRHSKKPKNILKPSVKQVKVQQRKKMVSPILPRKRTRASTKLLGEVSKSKPNQPTVSVTSKNHDSVPSATDVSMAYSEIESDDHTHFNPPLSPLKQIETTPGSYASEFGKNFLAESPPPHVVSSLFIIFTINHDSLFPCFHFQYLTARCAMVSTVQEDIDFDFSFLGS